MNKREIDQMMRRDREVTVAGEILAGVSFTLFVVMICLL